MRSRKVSLVAYLINLCSASKFSSVYFNIPLPLFFSRKDFIDQTKASPVLCVEKSKPRTDLSGSAWFRSEP